MQENKNKNQLLQEFKDAREDFFKKAAELEAKKVKLFADFKAKIDEKKAKKMSEKIKDKK